MQVATEVEERGQQHRIIGRDAAARACEPWDNVLLIVNENNLMNFYINIRINDVLGWMVNTQNNDIFAYRITAREPNLAYLNLFRSRKQIYDLQQMVWRQSLQQSN